MSRTPSSVGLAVATLLAAVLVGVGGALALHPALILESVPDLRGLLESIDPGLVLLALVALFVILAPTLGIAGRLRPSTPTPLARRGSTSATAARGDELSPRSTGARSQHRRRRSVGATTDEQLSLATAYDDEPRDIREAARERLLESLRSIAATTYASHTGSSAAAATAAIEAGTWTDDPRAAAFLAGDDGPSTPLWLWLFDLASGADPLERQLEAAIAELETLQAAPAAGGSTDSIDVGEATGTEAETTAEVSA